VGSADELTVDLAALGVGTHELALQVADRTAKVRSDPQGLLARELHWQLVVEVPVDADQDGLPDAYELANGLNPADPADARDDADQDGLTNLAEFLAGTDPQRADTDGDEVDDREELADGTDPLDAAHCATCGRSFVARFASALPGADTAPTEPAAAAARRGAGAGPR
jgi:hypothetical protein